MIGRFVIPAIRFVCPAIALAVGFASSFAAPPTATSLFPSGGARGSTVAVTVNGSFDNWPVSVWSSSAGLTFAPEKEKGKLRVTIAKEAPKGVAWLRFHDESGASALRPFIVGDLPETIEVEPNGEVRSAQPISLPAVVNGTLSKSGDVDCFQVKLNKGQTLVASVTAHESLRSPIDTVMQILSADGSVREQNNDARGLDSEMAFTAPTSGVYIVRLFAFPAAPDSSIHYYGSAAGIYRLTLTTDEFIDFATPLSMESGREAKVKLTGWNLKQKTVSLAANETTIGQAHAIPIVRVPHACLNVGTLSDQPLSTPFSATGRIETPKQHATIRVQGQAGKALAIHLDTGNLGFSLTPVLRILDEAAKPLARVEPAALNGPLDTTFTPKANGPFRIEVQDLLGSAGPRHVYQLTVTPVVPTLEAKVAQDRYTITVGTPLDIPITLVRKNGFAGDLIPFTEGLPDGVTAEITPVEAPKPDPKEAGKPKPNSKETGKPVAAAAKPDPNLVSLRLKALKPGVRGVIKIGVERKEKEPFKTWAVSPNGDFEQSVSQIWLTVVAPTKPAAAPPMPQKPKK
ncbi:MAG: PPC domain-containing protein [Gemmataceae bacterium]